MSEGVENMCICVYAMYETSELGITYVQCTNEKNISKYIGI